MLAQVQGHINCSLAFGSATMEEGMSMTHSEPLVQVVALEDIPAGVELLLDYGPDYFEDDE